MRRALTLALVLGAVLRADASVLLIKNEGATCDGYTGAPQLTCSSITQGATCPGAESTDNDATLANVDTSGGQSNKVLVVVATSMENHVDCLLTASAGSVTWGGQTLTFAASARASVTQYLQCSAIFYLKQAQITAECSGGCARTVTATWAETNAPDGIDTMILHAFVLTGVKQGPPAAVATLGESDGSDSIEQTIAVDTGASGDFIVVSGIVNEMLDAILDWNPTQAAQQEITQTQCSNLSLSGASTAKYTTDGNKTEGFSRVTGQAGSARALVMAAFEEVPAGAAGASMAGAAALDALWYFEEATATDNAADTAGSNDPLDAQTSVTRSTTEKQQGARAALPTANANEWFECTIANCANINVSSSGRTCFNLGGWVRPGSMGNLSTLKTLLSDFDSNTGYEARLDMGTSDEFLECAFGNGTGQVLRLTTPADSVAIDRWDHVWCEWDSQLTNEVRAIINADELATGDRAAWGLGSGSLNVSDGATANARYAGYLDEWFVYDGCISDAFKSKVVACGWDSTKCSCDWSGDPDYLPCASNTDCSGCSGCSSTAICNTGSGTCNGRPLPAGAAALPACDVTP